MQFIKDWILNNHLDVEWINDMSFLLDGKKYLFIKHKNGKIFNDQFDLLVGQEESELALLADHPFDYYCFQFGDKVYYSPRLQDKIELNILRYRGKAKDIFGIPYLGVHGGYELCNGSRVYEDWCKKASFLGITHLAICERNTLAGVLKFQITCKKHNIIPIIGMTAIVKNSNGDRYQVKIFVRNQEGWQSLLKINRQINVENSERYVDEEYLLSDHRGIIVVLGEIILNDEALRQYRITDNTEFYFQIDPAQYKSVERDKKKLEAYKQYVRHYQSKIPPVIICDSYYLEQQDHHIKKTLNTIGNIGFDHQSEDQFFKPANVIVDQLQEMFTTLEGKDQLIDTALENVYRIADQCNFTVELGQLKLPQYKMTEEESKQYHTNTDLLWGLIQKGLEDKVIAKDKDIDVFLERIETEVKVIEKSGVIDYFLILADIITWSKNNGILSGIGRGSAAGSAVAYLLNLTKLDPIQYDLLFERFLNEGRAGKSLPDIDSDFPTSRRDDVKRYIEQRYGANNVCSIGTYGTFKIKAALKDLCRMKGIPPQTVNYFSVMLSDREDEFHSLFYDAVQSTALKDFISQNVDVVSDIPLILNQPKNASMHAAGVVITPTYGGDETIYTWMPVKKVDGVLVSEWEGPELEAAGYLKEDILGIKQLDKFTDILKYVWQNYNQRIDFEDIDYNDQEVYKLFQKGYNQDLFHFGSVGLTSYSQEVKPESIEELIAMIALYRPGAMEFRAHEDYVKIKFGKKEPQYDFGLKEITESTYGLYIYQEQVMKACQVLGGVSLVEADDIRKAMGKKDLEKLKSFKAKFIRNAISKGCKELEANKIWNKLEAFAEYGFNRSHAAAYAMTGYFCQYLKCYYPMEFWTVSLQYADEDEIPQRIAEIRKLQHITILPPDINNSQKQFTSDFETNTIYWSLSKIKFAGEGSIDTIIKERESNGKFFSIEEFYSRVPKRTVNKRVVVNLILSGCFDQLYNIEVIEQRRDLLKQFYELIGEDLPSEYDTNLEFFWFLQQKQISGSGYFDYSKLISNSEIPKIDIRYLTPDRVLLPDNVDCEGVVIGMLVDVIQKNSKKGLFAQLILDHNNEVIEITLWSEKWEEYKEILEKSKEKIIIVSGKVVSDRYKKHNIIHSTNDTIVEII